MARHIPTVTEPFVAPPANHWQVVMVSSRYGGAHVKLLALMFVRQMVFKRRRIPKRGRTVGATRALRIGSACALWGSSYLQHLDDTSPKARHTILHTTNTVECAGANGTAHGHRSDNLENLYLPLQSSVCVHSYQ
uniref:Uncharacterized protein n=1 Tax=Anopheles culicifacies TaxID=139723 RepID=A0A182MC18_9DIPT